ncbi:hypothetical protein FC093_14130 [Ilyomonas limi]|uniref:Uncharacterized protein n=1 Tax=Ilyomonas limi TaxID=2575867 RepID=A0A4U3KYI2_9BACT|nr:LiaF domain-containing protein [Ilyomonas limi]TKK67432.1 hypothetical protein FC093_14130 [Ilyomonas limi]
MNNEDIRATNRTKRTMRHEGRVFTGAFLLLAGGILLASKLGTPIPGWVFSWETFLIILGLFIGIKHRFRHPFWLILVFIGSASLIDDAFPLLNIRTYIWPVAIMILGLFFLLKPKRIRMDNWQDNDYGTPAAAPASLDNLIDITAVFAGVRRGILSKNFQGGDITAFMGGAEIDLTQADIQGTVVLDVTAVFGGVKLVVPADWEVQSHATAIFGGVEDKRFVYPALQSGKVLVLDGVAVFGGVEIKSYPMAAK